jgi:hypothetical protein
MEALARLRQLLIVVPGRLERLPDPGRKTSADRWSPKEELGHLLDSAANNHQRMVRVQLQEGLAMPGYAQEEWVRLHAYQQRDWQELIQLWSALNRQLLAAAEAVPDSAWRHPCTVAGSEPLSLRFVLEDYVRHMLHHLQHIGIEIDDLEGTAAGADN